MDTNSEPALIIPIPSWIDELVAAFPGPLETDDQRMALALALARVNVGRGGGPFAALVFEGPRLAGAGVNRVVDTGFSIAHAEILALTRAQQAAVGRGRAGGPLTLVTTAEPCCQCFGALVWAGVEELVSGATTADAESVGFDEGPKPEDWIDVLERRGVRVRGGVRRAEAQAILEGYVRGGGTIYGMRSPRRA